ncbi:hypothetical protein EC957_005642 [Mortierella hygrophila]|uniref:START domain-containing protein n=1 Tax=Mortierella hygrophila TaxID=979708 RepID=A0A9P6JZF1_9FUNG|nr:hypothetical protein EC957_005642 [Mortierella hygrophila]
MDLNHDSATERYTETLTSALTYFSSLAQSSSGWKRLSSASVRPNKNGSSGSPGSAGRSGTGATSSAASSPVTSRHNDDILSNLPGGASASSAASAAIESLLPAITVSKKSVPGKSAEIVRASIVLPGLNEQTDLEDWRAVLECSGARKIWDPMVESSNVLMTLDDSTCITKTIFKTTWPASPRDALLIETTLLDHNAVLHIATSIKPSHDDPIFLRPSPPHVRAYLPLVAWHIQLVPADMDDTVSFTSFNSLTASQNKPVMPRHSIRVSFYYQIDMRGWAVNSSVSMQSHVPSCIANVYRLLRRQGVPPHVSRHSPRIQLDLNEYDPATGIYELRYDVIPSDSEDLLLGQRTVSSALKRFRLGGAAVEEGPELGKVAQDSSSIPQELVLSDDEGDDLENNGDGNNPQHGYVDVELDGEKWGLGSDIVVHIFMNDIEDEEFVQEHVECLKYMGRDRYILRMKHTETGPHHGAINVKLRIERIPQETSGSANLLSHQQLRFQRQQQERENEQQQQNQLDQDQLPTSDLNNLSVSVNGQEKNILPFHRSSIPPTKRLSMSLQEQLELSQQIVQEVDTGPSHWQAGSDGLDGQEVRTTASPLLLMSSSMPTTMQNLNRSNQSFMSNGTSTMQPGNTNPSKVNSSYGYFNSLMQEPATSWKPMSKQRGVQISKLEVQGHAPGIVKGEGIFEDYTIWDIKAVLDCPSARKIWDKMFDESHMLQHATPSSILSYVRFKGFWPASPKDMAVLNTTFITKDAIHYFATSVDDTNLYPAIPPPVSPFVRSELVVSGWYLQTVKPKSVRIVYIAHAAPTGWMVPGTALGAMATEMPLCVAEIIKYLETYGSPPTLVSIRRGRALGVEYSHEKSSFRLEYVQDSNPIFSGHRQPLQQQHQHHQSLSADRQRRSTVDLTAGVGSGDPQQFGSPKLGPTDKLLAEIRLDARVWARNGDCDITIDPPPSKVSCSSVPHDGTGYRLRIEHSSGRAVPAGGKVLLMARKPTKPGCGIVVNGVPINMPSMEHLLTWMPHHALLTDKDKSQAPSSVDGTLAEKESQGGEEDESGEKPVDGTGENGQTSEPGVKRGPSTLMSPLQYAQGAMDLFSKINSDPEDSWTVVSDSKGGMKVTKRFMPSEISDQVPLVRGEKVIEGFSLEEIATVIGTLGTRAKLDDLYESGEMLESFGAGCSTFHHVLKSFFPLPLPARDLYFVTATAFAEASARRPQIVIISTSIPHGGASKATDEASTSTSTPPQSRPRAHLHLSAWILEGIDPYSSNHPIPSTRVTFMTALDLGGSVPQRISGMIQTMFPKMITQVESYLQAQAAPPIIRIPEQMVVGESLLVEPTTTDENPPQLPPIVPWIKPANRIVSWDFKMKEYYCELILLFDQFRLNPSRLDLAKEIRAKKSKKARRKSKQHIKKSGSPEQNVSDEDQDEQTTKDESTKVKSRTVMELVVDLKQYPMGYNIITNIKVDPELLLQHKQQRDSGLKQAMSSSVSAVKLAGSTSTPGTAAASSAASKLIGGFDGNGKGSLAELNGRPSLDGDGVFHKSMSSEAATSGTGIAAVLGGSANVPRALPSSTSLIRILPPAITVNIIDIPPAPSHSSSLSGVSKRRKHLIVITVPEAESSASYLQSLQQAAAAPLTLKSAAPHAISGATAKPVVTASSVAGTTSTMFPDSDHMEYRQSRHLTNSSSSQELGSTTESTRPAFSPGKPATPEPSVKQQQEQLHSQQLSSSSEPPKLEVETRVFQFGVKIDRLEHKDLDHQALKEAKASPDEQEWLGRVMVDGMPVKVVTSWSRHELGFLDGMMEDLDDPQDGRGSRRKKSSSRRKSYGSAEQDEGSDLRSADSMDDERSRRDAEGEAPEQERRGSRTVSRRRKHHRQQLSLLADPHEPKSDSAFNNHNGRTSDPTPDGARPTSTLTGFSGFLMSVGLLGSSGSKGSQGDSVDAALDDPDAESNENSRRQSALEYEDLDDDKTIRASKSTSRSGISGILNGTGSRGKANGRDRKHDDHDLDLESLHGSIVFHDRGDDTDQGGYSHRSGDELPRSTQYAEDESRGLRAMDKDVSDWAHESGTVRRRKGRSALQPRDKDLSSTRPSLDTVRSPRDPREPIESGGADSEVDSRLAHRRRNSRSSASKYQRSRIVHASSTSATARRTGSTNGADHPRFRGSLLYAYTFRNMVWSAIAFFLIGMLLRVYVIGPSFLKTANSNIGGGGANSGPATTTAYYYYYRAAAPTGHRSTGGPLKSTSPFGSHLPIGGGGGGQQEDGYEDGRDEGAASGGMDNSVWPQGIREVFTVRRILGWDFVFLAYPSQDLQQQQSSSSRSSPS